MGSEPSIQIKTKWYQIVFILFDQFALHLINQMLNHMYKHMFYFYNLMYYNWSQNVSMDICLVKKVWEARYGSDPAMYYTNKHRHQYQKLEIKHITDFVLYIGRVVEYTVCFHYAALLYTTYIWFIFAFFKRLWLWPTRIVILPSWRGWSICRGSPPYGQ